VVIYVFDDSLFVDNENYPIAETVLGKDTILLSHLAMRPEI